MLWWWDLIWNLWLLQLIRGFRGHKNVVIFWHICTFGIFQVFSETVEKPQKLILGASKYLILLHPKLGKLQKLDFFDSLPTYHHFWTPQKPVIFILYLKCNNPLFQFLQDYVLDCAIHILTELCTSAMNTQFGNLG